MHDNYALRLSPSPAFVRAEGREITASLVRDNSITRHRFPTQLLLQSLQRLRIRPHTQERALLIGTFLQHFATGEEFAAQLLEPTRAGTVPPRPGSA